jgi:hypothetical protein
MTSGDLLTGYVSFAANLGVDLVAILVMTYVLYFRRHRRSDLLLSYVALNMGIFVTMSVRGSVDVAVGFGLSRSSRAGAATGRARGVQPSRAVRSSTTSSRCRHSSPCVGRRSPTGSTGSGGAVDSAPHHPPSPMPPSMPRAAEPVPAPPASSHGT